MFRITNPLYRRLYNCCIHPAIGQDRQCTTMSPYRPILYPLHPLFPPLIAAFTCPRSRSRTHHFSIPYHPFPSLPLKAASTSHRPRPSTYIHPHVSLRVTDPLYPGRVPFGTPLIATNTMVGTLALQTVWEHSESAQQQHEQHNVAPASYVRPPCIATPTHMHHPAITQWPLL